MYMKIGDKVRFLDAEGGGIVKGFDSKGLVLVEDEDGFEIPTIASQCVVVSEEEDQRQDQLFHDAALFPLAR